MTTTHAASFGRWGKPHRRGKTWIVTAVRDGVGRGRVVAAGRPATELGNSGAHSGRLAANTPDMGAGDVA
ncbi:hypothetical protein [Streptomyces sp. NPDC058572]|uniref:hypothetical protein n=1 Tax=Streptomyces sp. NPDC058572 TaxID=3346546 RepID=UPI0036541246